MDPCTAGYTGPLCQACTSWKFRSFDGACEPCSKSPVSQSKLTFIVFRLAMSLGFLYLFRWLLSDCATRLAEVALLHEYPGIRPVDGEKQTSEEQKCQTPAFDIRRNLAIAWSTLGLVQRTVICLASFSALIPGPLPLGVDLLGWLAFTPTDTAICLECMGSSMPNFHVIFVGVLLLPIALDLRLNDLAEDWSIPRPWAAAPQSSQRMIPLWKKLFRERVSATVSWATWLALSPAIILLCTQAFACDEFEDLPGSYLHADYSVRCDTSGHLAVQTFAGIFLAYVGVVLPLRLLARNTAACRASRAAHSQAESFFAETSASVASVQHQAKTDRTDSWSQTKQSEPPSSAVEATVASILSVALSREVQKAEQQAEPRGPSKALVPSTKSVRDRMLVALGFPAPTHQPPALCISSHSGSKGKCVSTDKTLATATCAVILCESIRPLMRDFERSELISVFEALGVEETNLSAEEFSIEHILCGFANTRHDAATGVEMQVARAEVLSEEDRSFLHTRLRHCGLLQSQALLKSPLPLWALFSELAWLPQSAEGMSGIGLSDPTCPAFAAQEAMSMLSTNTVVALVALYHAGFFTALVVAVLVTTAESMRVVFAPPFPSTRASLFQILGVFTTAMLILCEIIALAYQRED